MAKDGWVEGTQKDDVERELAIFVTHCHITKPGDNVWIDLRQKDVFRDDPTDAPVARILMARATAEELAKELSELLADG